MSLEQYKDANRKELWEILQIQVERIAELEKERDELNKQCGEFQEGFFSYMAHCDHLQIEADNLKKKISNLTTPDESKKSGGDA
jgi:regulator of replication initiation timing